MDTSSTKRVTDDGIVYKVTQYGKTREEMMMLPQVWVAATSGEYRVGTTIQLQLSIRDFDGEIREVNGPIDFQIEDVVIAVEFVRGIGDLILELDAAGRYTLSSATADYATFRHEFEVKP